MKMVLVVEAGELKRALDSVQDDTILEVKCEYSEWEKMDWVDFTIY